MGQGDGSPVPREYDSQGRLLLETYEDGQTVSYAYDNSGNLATVTDSETGIVTTYYYDLLNRLVGYREKSTSLDHAVTYIYDAENNLSSMTEVVNGVTKVYSYTYNEDNRLTSMSVDGTTVTYTYDDFGRVSERQVKQGDTVIESIEPDYYETETATSGQVVSYNGYSYTYDKNGNILTVSDGTYTTRYMYDNANQLIREFNEEYQFVHVWEYDNAGNILNRKEYPYINGKMGTLTHTVYYAYANTEWGDLLTQRNGTTIIYDGIGNPTTDGTWNYTWKHGRQLASMRSGSTTWTYTYDANGMRISRSNGTDTYSYVYDGSRLVTMTEGANLLQFTYDAAGTPLSVTYNGTKYYYSTNLQGDIIQILDNTGATVTTYAYDAWGNLLSCTGTLSATLGTLNPLRYRGYVYDTETELYYLQSRYYNPEWGRFINADGLVATGQGLLGNNMFAYCLNNPVNYVDHSGAISEKLLIIIAKTLLGGLQAAKNMKSTGASDEEVFYAFLEGLALGFASAICEPVVIIYEVYNTYKTCRNVGATDFETYLACGIQFLFSLVGIKNFDSNTEKWVYFIFGAAADWACFGITNAIEYNNSRNTMSNTIADPIATESSNSSVSQTSTSRNYNPKQSPPPKGCYGYVPKKDSWKLYYYTYGWTYFGKIDNGNAYLPIVGGNILCS